MGVFSSVQGLPVAMLLVTMAAVNVETVSWCWRRVRL